jgi:hypothetical protein
MECYCSQENSANALDDCRRDDARVVQQIWQERYADPGVEQGGEEKPKRFDSNHGRG